MDTEYYSENEDGGDTPTGGLEVMPGLTRERRLWRAETLERVLLTFSPGERLALYVLSSLLGLSALILLIGLNISISVLMPARGGSLTEGEVGPARFINPVLMLSQADQDISALVYSGLVRALPDGEVVPDLAASYTISPDGRVYTFKLRPNATFQDGTAVTSADVAYTVQEAQNPALNSPQRADWEGVAVSTPDPETVVFTLPHAYAPFIQNATLGILPRHLWQSISDEEFPFSPLNTHPIGSGPYKILKAATDSTGAAARYDLVPFKNFSLGEPYISTISFVFFQSDDALIKALSAGKIDAAAGVDASQLSVMRRSDASVAIVPLPRDFGIFFNQSRSKVLADPAVRAALAAAVDKQAVIDQSISGLAAPLDGPIPPGLLGKPPLSSPRELKDILKITSAAANATASPDTADARSILQRGGWVLDAKSGTWSKNKQTLSFVLSTAETPALVATANTVAAEWRSAGIQVSVQIYSLSELNTSVIRPRNYDAVLFGEVVGPELDLYAFWHSSQRSDPGLNLSMYANSKADAILAQARATIDTSSRDNLYQSFAAQVAKDNPAVFLYAPYFVYVVPSDLQGIRLGALQIPADRFDNVYQWYTDTRYVWDIFAPPEALKNQAN